MTLRQAIVAQFGNPRGALGHLAGFVMAHRASNVLRNRWTVELLSIEPAFRCLEIGCGPGLGIAEAAKRATQGRIVGIDRSAVMIAQARRRNLAAVRAGRVALHAGTLDELPAEGTFDRIWSVNVIGFVADRPRFFASILQHLAPGGLAATTYMPRHKGASTADAAAMAERLREPMQSAGFADIRVETLPLHPVGAISVLGCRP